MSENSEFDVFLAFSLTLTSLGSGPHSLIRTSSMFFIKEPNDEVVHNTAEGASPLSLPQGTIVPVPGTL